MNNLLGNEIEIIKEESKVDNSRFELMLKESFIDLKVKIPPPPVVISIGSHDYRGYTHGTRFATKGNFTCISGASKSKKTFFKSMIAASYIGGNAGAYFPEIKTHRDSEAFFIDIDTEQSKYDSQFVFERTVNLVGGQPDFYKPFSLRKRTHKERLELIDYIIYESEYRDNIGLISIDGLADLISDVNNIEESNRVIQKLLTWTDEKQIHIMTILHTNPNSEKVTGHLGTFVDKKAETRCVVKTDESGIATVNFLVSRGYPISQLQFKVDPITWLPTTKIGDNDFIEPRDFTKPNSITNNQGATSNDEVPF